MKSLLLCLTIVLGAVASLQAQTTAARPNVLLICVDDLRPQLGCYGEKMMRTPNLDQLARTGRLFQHHFAVVPTCGASRYALLTGLRPSRTNALGNDDFRKLKGANPPTALPALFRQNGYRTVSIGKISHSPDGLVYGYNEPENPDALEMPGSWDVFGLPTGKKKWGTGWDTFFAYADGTSRASRRNAKQPAPPFESPDVPDEAYPDGLIAADAVAQLAALQQQEKPFFLAVGFFKPHLPFNAPKKYWDLYDESTIGLSPCPAAPTGINPKWSLHGSGEFYAYNTPRKARSDEAYERRTRHAYFAAVSYVDAQIGKVLDALEELKLADNTIVIVWGDHGWHLGDLTIWGKHTLYEHALRSALLIRTPNQAQPGAPAAGLVETLDIYPTLADLCNITPPSDLAGESLRPLLENAQHPGKTAAFGYYGRAGGGVTMRTDRYRITYFRKQKDQPHAVELYDHQTDPNETKNIADAHPELVEKLLRQLQADAPKLGS